MLACQKAGSSLGFGVNSLYVALSSDVASPEELSGTQPENFFFWKCQSQRWLAWLLTLLSAWTHMMPEEGSEVVGSRPGA